MQPVGSINAFPMTDVSDRTGAPGTAGYARAGLKATVASRSQEDCPHHQMEAHP
jgi:hypothetical protein